MRTKTPKYLLTALAILPGISAYAQGPKAEEFDSLSVFSNPLFLTLLGVIILLTIVIAVLGGVLTNVAEITKNKSNNSKKVIAIAALISLTFAGNQSFAQTVSNTVTENPHILNAGIFYFMFGVIGFELIIILVFLNSIKLFVKKEEVEVDAIVKEEPSIFEKLNASVAVEKEEQILFHHEYDGIRELDNDLPPWWKYGFYLTIVIAIIYLINYHIIRTGDLQTAEYDKSMVAAQTAKEEFEKINASNVNENNVTMLEDKIAIATGGEIFKGNCFACHGKFGEGGVGPNLTDDYWLHGGSIKSVFASIKFGWADKGMKSWQVDFSPVQIHQIASYIKTLRGSNPPNPKAQQGDLYIETAELAKDSVTTDTLKLVTPATDTLNKK
jgi:cytochrome c oxidase cbb3-type subunit 3